MDQDPHALLRRIVAERGITRAEIAGWTGKGWSAVWRWLAPTERGRTRPDEVSRRVLETRLGIPADAWLTDEERAVLARTGS